MLLGKKATTNLDSLLKSRDITLPIKVCIVKAMVFSVVMYGCESWTIKLSAKELMLLNCGAGEDSCCYCWVTSVMSDSVWPHRWQPTRLPRPWDSPGKNTGVGCHFLLQCMKVKSESEVAQSYLTLSDPTDCSLPGSSTMVYSRQEYWSGVPLGEDSWESLKLQGDQTSQTERQSTLNIHWKDWCWRWSSNTLATWCEELTHWKRP